MGRIVQFPSTCGDAARSRALQRRGRTQVARRGWHQQIGLVWCHQPCLTRHHGLQIACLAYEENDVVVFQPELGSPSGEPESLAVGCITRVDGTTATVEELGRDTNADTRPGISTWLEAGSEHRVPVAAILRVLEADFSQRVDADRVSNPHGEHAHDVWEIMEPVDLGPGTRGLTEE